MCSAPVMLDVLRQPADGGAWMPAFAGMTDGYTES